MKSPKDRIKEIRPILFALEMDLNVLESQIIELGHRIIGLENVKDGLIWNLSILKQDGIITSAYEYKRTREQLKIINTKLYEYESRIDFIRKTFDKKVKSFDYYNSEYDKALYELEQQKVVLLFDLKKRKKKKDE